jgi:F-type H+-transporting ATPase subunit b
LPPSYKFKTAVIMDLVTPNIGLVFWSVLTFSIVFIILSQTAWKPIVQALKDREKSITDALSAAAKAKLTALQAGNEKLLQEARMEREKMLRDAKTTADKMIAEAAEKANTEKNRIVLEAQEAIRNEKNAALADVKKQVADLSLEIAEKVMKKQLDNKNAQIDLVKSYLAEAKIN